MHKFSAKGLSSKEAAGLVGEIPENKEWLTSRSVSRREFRICAGSCGQPSEKLVTVSLKDVTFRTLLNTLIREFGTADWMVGRDLYYVFTTSKALAFEAGVQRAN
jgi:hypothetical protein